MGNGIISCCDTAYKSKAGEFSISSPKTLKTPIETGNNSEMFPSLGSPPSSLNIPDLENRLELLQSLGCSKNLTLKVINSGNLPKGTTLSITPKGIEKGFRNANDGYTFFGCKKKQKGQVVNDYVIPIKQNELGDHHRGRHFMVFYQIEKDSYWIRDLSKGFGVFVRLDYALVSSK